MDTTARTATLEALRELGLTAEQRATFMARLDAERREAARNERARCAKMLGSYMAQDFQPMPVVDYAKSLLSPDYD